MNYQEGERITADIENAIGKEEQLLELYGMLCSRALHYTTQRVKWQSLPMAGRLAMDAQRTLAHNNFIDSCNILSRAMKKMNLDISWRERLGTERKTIGDFACYLVCNLGIRAR